MANILDNTLALGSVPYNFAKGIIGNPSNPGATTQVSLTDAQKDYLDNIAQSKGTSGTIDYSDYGSPTKTFSGISGMDPMEVSLATTMGGTGYTTNPDGSINYTGGAYDFNKGNVITDFIDRGGIIGAADLLGKNIYDKFNPSYEDEDKYDFSGIKGQTAGLNIPLMLKSYLKKRLKYGAASTAANLALEAKAKAAAKAKADAAAKAKADAAAKAKADAAPSQRRAGKGGTHMSRNRDQGGLGISQSQAQAVSDANRAAGMSGWGLADGGLINFYRYGGFI